MPQDINSNYLSQRHTSYNEPFSKTNTNNDIFQDSEEVQNSDSESIILDTNDRRVLKPHQYADDFFKSQRKDLSTDGEFKESYKEKKSTTQNKILNENQFEESQLIDDSIKNSGLKSQILAHYKLGDDQEIFRIDIKSQKKQKVSESKKQKQPKSPHWQPIQVPENLFEDSESLEASEGNNNHIAKSSVKPFDHKDPKQSIKSIKDVNKEQNMIKTNNFLNPFTYFKAFQQEQKNKVLSSCQPCNQQQFNGSLQPQNTQYATQPASQFQINPNFPQIQHSHTVNWVPPFSPRSDVYWQPNQPQQQYTSFPYYGGVQLAGEMRFLRQEVKMLRQLMSYERNERQLQMRYKRQSDRDFDKFEKIVQSMKKTIETERQQHKQHLQELSNKFIGEIKKLKASNISLQEENQTLRLISQSPHKQYNQMRLNFRQRKQRDVQNADKKSVHKIKDLQEILDKKIATNQNTQETLNRKIRTSKQIQQRKKQYQTPKRRKESEKKSF